MDVCRPAYLAQSLNERLHIPLVCCHEIRKLIYHDINGSPGVIALSGPLHFLIAAFRDLHCIVERLDHFGGFAGIHESMRQGFVGAEFNPFRIYENKPDISGALVQGCVNNAVYYNGFPAACGSGYE
jgi:hypothetical protein